MRVLVVGGTQFIGLGAVKRLVAEGHEVAVFHRGNRCHVLPLEVDHLHGDSNELSRFRGEIADFAPDAVLHMLLAWRSDTEEFVRALDGLTPRVVVASSANVYLGYSRLHGHETGTPIEARYTESGPLREHRFSQDSGHDEKIEVEQTIMAAERLQSSVVRLPAVYGPNDVQHRGYEFLWKMDAGRPHILVNDVFGRWKWARGYVDNMVEALLLVLQSEDAVGRIFNVAEEAVMTQVEWIRALGRVAGWNGEVIATAEAPPPGAADYRHHWAMNSSSIRTELGYKERISSEDALARTVEWLRANPPSQERIVQMKATGLSFDEEDRLAAQLS